MSKPDPSIGMTVAALVCLAIFAGCSQPADPTASPGTSTTAGSAEWVMPRTPWGDPDLRGLWPIGHLTGVPLQRPPQYGERQFLTDEELAERATQFEQTQGAYDREIDSNKMGMGHWVEWGQANRLTGLIIDPPDGQLPALTPGGERRRAEMRSGWMSIPFDQPTDFDNWDRCITRGLPASMLPAYYNNGIEILQSPGYVVIRLEMIHEARVVPVDGRPPVDDGAKAWLGYSVGHWEGDTLVVTTTNFNAQGSSTNIHTVGSPPFNNTPISTEYTLTERFTRTGPDTLTYRATVDDPVIWTAPWTVELPWQRDPGYAFFEYACHEDNSMIRNYIQTSRFERAEQARE